MDKLSSEPRDYPADAFDLRWKADMRAIKRWQATHPGKENIWPDHADLVVWLMGGIGASGMTRTVEGHGGDRAQEDVRMKPRNAPRGK